MTVTNRFQDPRPPFHRFGGRSGRLRTLERLMRGVVAVRASWLGPDVVEPASDSLDRGHRRLAIAICHGPLKLVEELGRLVVDRLGHGWDVFAFHPSTVAEVSVDLVEMPAFDGGSVVGYDLYEAVPEAAHRGTCAPNLRGSSMPRKIRNGRILIGAIRNIREVEHWNDDEAGLRPSWLGIMMNRSRPSLRRREW